MLNIYRATQIDATLAFYEREEFEISGERKLKTLL
jgi:hypothetical protein